jgi:transmembrane sensor
MENRMEYIEELMVARLTGNIEQKDSEFLDEMIEADQEVAAIWQQHLLIQSQLKNTALDSEQLWQKVRTGIHQHEEVSDTSEDSLSNRQSNTKNARNRKVPLMAFASILVIAVIGIVYYLMPVNKTNNPAAPAPVLTAANTIRFSSGAETVAIDRNIKGVIAMNAAEVVSENGMLVFKAKAGIDPNTISTLEVPQGLDRKVLLPDSTIVYVNAATKLSFPLAFTGNTRTVTLNGEAYFEVYKNKAKPFIVHARDMDVEVKGTHFNIKAYAHETIQTSLTEGSVLATAKGNQLLLTPGNAAVLQNGKLNERAFEESVVLGWMSGSYIFAGEELVDISHTVDRWFGYTFAYTSPEISSKRFTGNLEKSQSLESFLDNVCASAGLTYTIKDRLVTLSKPAK